MVLRVIHLGFVFLPMGRTVEDKKQSELGEINKNLTNENSTNLNC